MEGITNEKKVIGLIRQDFARLKFKRFLGLNKTPKKQDIMNQHIMKKIIIKFMESILEQIQWFLLELKSYNTIKTGFYPCFKLP